MPNDRVELAMAILECRRKLLRLAQQDETARAIRAKLADLETKLREIDR